MNWAHHTSPKHVEKFKKKAVGNHKNPADYKPEAEEKTIRDHWNPKTRLQS